MAKKYKYLITKLAVFAVMVVGFSLFLSGGKVFAVDCPSAVDNIPPRWGVQDNNLANHFASVVVYAYNADTGNKIDGVKFRLNSNVDTAYNYGPAPSGLSDPTLYPSARIFKVHINSATNTIETDARYNQKSFTIGEQLTAPASPCPGWDELGPGTSDHQGNGYMLDCQEVDTNGNKHNNRFWIDQIDTPGGSDGANGGKWTVEVSTGGADLTSRHFPMSYDNYFAVANGQNARVHLIWHPKKAVHGGIVNTACFTTLATDIKGENSFGDETGNLPVKLRYHNGSGSSPVNTTYSGDSSGGRYSHATPDYVQNRTSNIDVTVDLLVKDYTKPGDPYIQVDSASINEPCGGNPTCPSIPVNPSDINLTGDNSKVPVQSGNWNDGAGNLHQKNSYINDHLSDNNNLKGKNDIVWGDSANTDDFQYVIQKITDQYGQDISVPNPHWSPQDKSYNPFHINWTPFINQYPYDSHALTVTYTTWYRSYKYKATNEATKQVWVPGYWAGSGSDRHWVPGYWKTVTLGWRLVYQGEYKYDWHTSPNDVESHPGNGNWAKAECYDRGFQVHDISGSSTLNGDNESPTGATFTFSIPVHFFLPQGDTALRNPNKVCGINYSANYYIKHADGTSGGPMPGHSSDSGALGAGGCLGGNWSNDVTDSFTKSYSTTLIPPMVAGDRICMNFSVGPAAGTMNEGGSITSVSQGGIGSAQYCSDRVVDKPYLRVYGADVIAGSSFKNGDTCPNPGDSRINAYRSTDSSKSGSGTQLAALALQGISGFGSAGLSGSWPWGLTFSNTDNVSGGSSSQPNDGGLYNGQALCSDDFYDTQVSPKPLNVATTSPADISNRVVNLNGGKPTQFLRNGDLTINGGTFDKQAQVFVNGDVYITHDISFGVTKYLGIIAKGNIYISKDVHRLDGLYVAQPDNSGARGYIYTCSNGFAPVAISELFANCHSQLVINGAFAAKYVSFLRSANSLRDSSVRESASASRAAEIFNFSPEIYLYTPVFEEVTTGQPYQYITTLPPIL